MGGNIAQIVGLQMADGVRQLRGDILVQRTAKGHIDHLEAAADAEDGFILLRHRRMSSRS